MQSINIKLIGASIIFLLHGLNLWTCIVLYLKSMSPQLLHYFVIKQCSSADKNVWTQAEHVARRKRSDGKASINCQPVTLHRKTKDIIIKNLSSQAFSNNEVKLLSKGLNFIQTPPVPCTNKSLLKDFDNFARTMCLKYMFADNQKTFAHPFNVKSTWQPPRQKSVALENYLEETYANIHENVTYTANIYYCITEFYYRKMWFFPCT